MRRMDRFQVVERAANDNLLYTYSLSHCGTPRFIVHLFLCKARSRFRGGDGWYAR
jgi:hypothetical protein